MKIKIFNKGEEAVLHLDGRIDANVAAQMEQTLLDTAERFDKLVLDFSKVPYISSAGLRLLRVLHKTMHKKGGSFAIYGVRDDVMDIFNVTGFSRLLDCRE